MRRALADIDVDDLVATMRYTGPEGGLEPAPDLVDRLRTDVQVARLLPQVFSFEMFIAPDAGSQVLGPGCTYVGDFHQLCRIVLHTAYDDFYVGVAGIPKRDPSFPSLNRLSVDSFGLDPTSFATLFVRRAALGEPISAMVADYTWAPTTPRTRVPDSQLAERLQRQVASLAGTVEQIAPHTHADDLPLAGTDVRGCRGNFPSQFECSLDLTRPDGSTATATVTLGRDFPRPLLVTGFSVA